MSSEIAKQDIRDVYKQLCESKSLLQYANGNNLELQYKLYGTISEIGGMITMLQRTDDIVDRALEAIDRLQKAIKSTDDGFAAIRED